MAKARVTVGILRKLLASGATLRAERLLLRLHPADRAPLLSGLSPEEIRTVVELLFRNERAASTLKELPPDVLQEVIEALSDERLAEALVRLQIDDLLELVNAIPDERREAVVAHFPSSKLAELRRAELYPPSSAGRVMTTQFIALDENMTAQQAIDRIRTLGDDTETIMYLTS